jgi:hypothetical protein
MACMVVSKGGVGVFNEQKGDGGVCVCKKKKEGAGSGL